MLYFLPQAEQVLTQEAATDVRTTYKSYLEEQLSKVDSYTPHAFMLQDHWAGMVWPTSEDAIRNPDTGVAVDVLKGVGTASVKVPDGFVCVFCYVRLIRPHWTYCDRISTRDYTGMLPAVRKAWSPEKG